MIPLEIDPLLRASLEARTQLGRGLPPLCQRREWQPPLRDISVLRPGPPGQLTWPGYILAEIKECVPQATLRDLYRPQTQFGVRSDEFVRRQVDRGGGDVMREVRRLARQNLRPEMPPSVLARLRESLRELEGIRRGDWVTMVHPDGDGPNAGHEPVRESFLDGIHYE
jgi:hypothetical protein